MATQVDRFDKYKMYVVEGSVLRLAIRVMERLYTEQRMNADEMRDWTNELNVQLHDLEMQELITLNKE